MGHPMLNSLTPENWLATAETLTDELLDAAAKYAKGSLEYETLCTEVTFLRALREYVLDTRPDDRESRGSYLVAIAVRESLQIDDDLIGRVGILYDRYRRWRTATKFHQAIGNRILSPAATELRPSPGRKESEQ